MTLRPGPRRGVVSLPASKSHAHRVLIADFLAGSARLLDDAADDCADILATKRCLRALAPHLAGGGAADAPLDCGESGTTRRLIGPVAAALGWKGAYVMRGRLAARPQIVYDGLASGVHELRGDVSSQFASGLLFALPLLAGDSEIRFTTPLASRGYVELTLRVLASYGLVVEETATGFRVPGSQRYRAPAEPPRIERDWSGAAFWLAMNALGSDIAFSPEDEAALLPDSLQPDRAVVGILRDFARPGPLTCDVSSCPDLFPVLTVVAACRDGETRFVGTRRLRAKESDRVAAMAEALARFGRALRAEDDAATVVGRPAPLRGGSFRAFGDHRIAMSVAVGATVADALVEVDDVACAAKSYPRFFTLLDALGTMPLR